ncbi:CheR family methyltransferase [Mesorhizobium sp. WSM4313]|uniref:CheR family methyltransferase n=1 Tax=Mesorhizobium sp. WSM4313 TaxID=2029412 RepID=UPI000BB015B9|nr:CheR family methyltransferase [Mesorhizobium sp. WSM4313]PBB17428.1 chemotaxis protein CheR [Mesorhizobium sp. WSM4313]
MTSQTPLIVGIGASAGGIPALEGFFRELPNDSGMAFIIVTHLSPERRSLLHEVIGRYTAISVLVAEEGAELRANTVHVMPEGKILTVRDGRLRLTDDDPVHRERKPIDILFASLAKDQGENAVGIVLSGGDSDGTLGVKAIKESGGITMAQAHDGSGPRNPEMPASAMASGLIDFAEPVEHMAERLLQIRESLSALDGLINHEQDRQRDQVQRVQKEISTLLRSHTGHDFSGYKPRTFMRRVARRMKVVHLQTLEAYLQRLHDDPSEVLALFRDLLINVTNFFRDNDAFSALKEQVLPRLFEGRGADETIRLWVPGCATGEEVYSLGILMREQMEGLEITPRVQIFATDIDEEALSVARAGRYPPALLADVNAERLKRFFRRDGVSYVVSKDVREICIFSPHNVISDPPFSRMDLVSCRNLLIYLGGELQSQVIPTFHYALKPGGYLFLGTSEGVARHADLFAPLDKQNRIFQARDHGGVSRLRRLPMAVDHSGLRRRGVTSDRDQFDANGVQLRQRAELQVLERHAPAHVVITHDGEILHYSSNTDRFLGMPRGAPNRHLFDLARRELRADLRAALRQAMETGRSASRQVLMLDENGEDGNITNLTIEPLDGPKGRESLYLVLFTPVGHWRRPSTVEGAERQAEEAEAMAEGELRELRERLQSTIEEYETALEELKSSNEELVSVNEEAQSTNEELEASKEEMQSLNEELTTINAELASSVEDLDRANADLRNLYAATQIATVFLDGNLVIRNFTPAAADFFGLRQADIGRPLTELAGALQYPDLETQVREVFRSGEGIERQLSTEDGGTHYLVRLAPYRNQDEEVGGVVITIVDVASLVRAEQQQKVLISELNHRVKNMLAVVISIAKSTRKTAPSLEHFSENLIGRLHAMARAYSLLSEADWTKVSIRDLVRAEAETFGVERLELEGAEVALAPQHALSLGMVIHEIATNAAKYGALSNGTGAVSVNWKHEHGRIRLQWIEKGGPKVQAPERKGFGLVLVEGQVKQQLGGELDLRFPPGGFVLELSFPL